MRSLSVESDYFNFDYCHFIPWHTGKCSSVHGHSSKIAVLITGSVNENGMLVDFGDLKVAVKQVLDYVDHKMLTPAYAITSNIEGMVTVEYEAKGLRHKFTLPEVEVAILDSDSTVENISGLLAEKLLRCLPANVDIVTVQVFEGIGKSCSATCTRTIARSDYTVRSLSDKDTFIRMADSYVL